MRAIEGYKQLFQGEPYRWYSFNSNYFVNSVVSAAGGNPAMPGVFAPAFAPAPAPAPPAALPAAALLRALRGLEVQPLAPAFAPGPGRILLAPVPGY